MSITEPVSLRDLAATVVDRVGLGDHSPFPGSTLARFWDHGKEPSEPSAQPVLSELIRGGKRDPRIKWPPALRGPMQSLVADGKTYIGNGDGIEELYDLEADPAEVHDLSGAMDAPRGAGATSSHREASQARSYETAVDRLKMSAPRDTRSLASGRATFWGLAVSVIGCVRLFSIVPRFTRLCRPPGPSAVGAGTRPGRICQLRLTFSMVTIAWAP